MTARVGPGRVATLEARVALLEIETRRAFDEAQREADTLFAQYQLSQLVASGGSPDDLASAVVVELVRLAGATAGAAWLGTSGSDQLELVAAAGHFEGGLPDRFDGVDAVRTWATGHPEVELLVLGDEPPATAIALRRGEAALDPDGLRIAQLARHELAVAFAGARLREALDRERAELGAIVDAANDIIAQVDEAGRVTRLNPAGERALGIRAADALGRPCREVLGCDAPGGHPAEGCPLAEVLASGDPIGYRETVVAGAQGAAIRVAGGYSRSAGGDSGVRATAILRDISAVQALVELREGFVATVSHELRTPLALVRGYAETLLHFDLEPTEQRVYVERIHDVSTRLTALISQILDVTYLDADPLVLERAPVTFGGLVARLRGDLALSGDDGRLVAELPADLPPVEVDAGRIGRVLENLVGNAMKYAPSDTPVVVSAQLDGDWLVASIDDEGVGIPTAERALVTEPFHRAWNVRESRIPGTGLGLYICRRLVEAHGGRLTIEDRPDGRTGTRVSFRVPIAAAGRTSPGRRPEAARA